MSSRTRLAILSTHPIQYHIPWYRGLVETGEVELKVFYAMLPDERQQGVGFGQAFQWDIPLLEGYPWQVLENRARRPGLDGFWGCRVAGLKAALKEWGADVVLVTGWHSFMLLQGVWVAKRLGLPLLVRGESNAMRERAWWKSRIHRILIAQFDAYLTIGKSNELFYQKLGIAACSMFPAPYFVDNQRFSEVPAGVEAIQTLRSGFDIPQDVVCFLYSGKLNQKKRIMDLLLAMAELKQRQLPAHLLVVGAGGLMDEARAFVAEHGLDVSFAGFLNQTEIPLAYHAADCLVLPSDYGETWGLVINEAMACGKPAIVSDRVGCGPDLIEDGVTGFRFPFGDIKALADCMVRMIQDSDGAREMGANAQSRVLKHYSVDQAVDGALEAMRLVRSGS